MIRTHHEKMAVSLLDQMLFSPEAAMALAHTRRRLKGGAIESRYVSRIGQTHRGASRWGPEQAAAYLRVHAGLVSGEFAQAVVGIGHAPELDRGRRENERHLNNLHKAFRVQLDLEQNGADADGIFWWEGEIVAEQSTGQGEDEGGEMRPVLRDAAVLPGQVPLEVGYTLPSRTLQHLVQRGGVARWAYHDTNVCVLLSMRPGHERLRLTRHSREAA